MRTEALDVVRRFARDHWVRLHGTPRVTVLAGSTRARALWREWAELAALDATLLEGDNDFDAATRDALSRAAAHPTLAIAVVAAPDVIMRWQERAPDRLRTLVAEGFVTIDEGRPMSVAKRPLANSAAALSVREPLVAGDNADTHGEMVTGASADTHSVGDPRVARNVSSATDHLDARSAAEAMLFEALEATPSTIGRFELNGRLSVRFGPDAAEVDLLSRQDSIAIEIDGYHHFTDPECYRRDRRKDVLLQTQGLLVIRLLAEDVMRDPLGSVSVVCRALACRPGRAR